MHKTLLTGLLGLAILTAVPQARAAEAAPDTSPAVAGATARLTLRQAMDEALEHNPSLRAVDHGAKAARFEAKGTARTRWGELAAEGSYSRLNDDQILRPMSRELLEQGFAGLPFDRNQRHYGFTYQVPLYLGGKLQAGIRVAKLQSRQADELLLGTRWQIKFNVASLYASEQALQAVRQAMDEQIAALEKTEQRLALMVREGKRPDVERLKVVEELESARASRASVEADRIKVLSLLLAVLGRDPSKAVTLEPLPVGVPSLAKTPEEIRRAALDASPVRRAHLGEQKAKSGMKVARSEFLPSFSAWGNALWHDAPSLDDSMDTWAVGVGVRLPLFAGGARVARLAAAREKHRAAAAQLDRVRLDLAARVEEALARFDASLSEVKAARARVAAGTEAARIEQIRYETGADTVEDLLRARAREQQAKAALARATAGALIAGQKLNTLAEAEVVR